MKYACAVAVATLVLAAGPASAQSPAAAPPPPFSLSAEALLLWFKGNATPPLVTDGVVGAPGTRTFVGGKDLDTNVNPGFRLTAGYALSNTLGIDSSVFYVPERTTTQSVSSSGQPGSTNLLVPFVNPLIPGEDTTQLSQTPTGSGPSLINYAGFAKATLTNSLLGADLNGSVRLPVGGPIRLDVLGGFRYFRLREEFTFTTSSPNNPPLPLDVFKTRDEFDTTNNFYGGQFGIRARGDWGPWYVSGVAKVAFGAMVQSVDINGQLVTNDFNNFGAPQTFSGGYLALSTNSGHRSRQVLAVVPELGLNVGYQITPWMSVFGGYTFLYANDVLRAPGQINRNINPTGRPAITGDPPAPLTGPAEPQFRFKSSDFWAQGLNVGVALRF